MTTSDTLTAQEALAFADLLLIASHLVSSDRSKVQPFLTMDEKSRSALAHAGPVPDLVRILGRVCAAGLQRDAQLWAESPARLHEGPMICPINETAYVRRDKGGILADICGFYLAFGFEIDPTRGEKPDHLIIELQFCAALCVLLARAVEEQDRENQEIVENALRAFLDDHLGAWWGRFARRYGECGADEWSGVVAEFHSILAGGLSTWIGASDVETGAYEPETEAETPYECGMVPGGSCSGADVTSEGRTP